jgi:uncharacterized protein YdbL (DUF1318 family)
MSARWYIARLTAVAAIGAVTAGGLAIAQQRDPAYSAARAAGQIGEKMDGYLGYVVPPSADVKKMVEDLNIKRKAVYAQQAQAQHATVEEYALTAGCLAISRTSPGEKYQAPDGSWTTRGTGAPQRDPRCP